jgi:hypothetical protein
MTMTAAAQSAAMPETASTVVAPAAALPATVAMAAMALLILALAAAALMATALIGPPVAGAAVWTEQSGAKVFPSAATGQLTPVELSAAGGEYEGAQIVLSGGDREVTFTWEKGSAPLLQSACTLHKVGYVTISKASTGTKASAGRYPDPLLPAAFGRPLRVSGDTTSFYLLVNVPRGTAGGDYDGRIVVAEGGSQTVVPVRLHVYGFDLPGDRVPSVFAINPENVKQSLRGAIPWTQDNQRAVLQGYYQLWKRYGFSPGGVFPVAWVDQHSGLLQGTDWYQEHVGRYLNADGIGAGFSASRYPWSPDWPWRFANIGTVRAKTLRYLTELCRLYKQNGWADGAYAFPYDEPSPGRGERRAEAAARILHQASAAAGYRAKYLLTTEPRPSAFDGRPQNRFLFDDVDIWATRVYRFWDWLPALRSQQAQGKEVWMYTYSFNPQARQAPTFLIDESLADEHAVYWMMWRWKATGLLYWRANKWSRAGGGGWRDPYQDPLSFRSTNGKLVFNGEASLIYPGYAPALGLRDPYAAPLSSLRFEALRDGIEEHAYLKLAEGLGGTLGTQVEDLAQRLAKALTDYPSGAYPWNWTNIPDFSKDASAYDGARRRLAEAIERAAAGREPAGAVGRVLTAAGAPLAGATVSDGVLRTTTAADGSFRLVGVLAAYRLTASHPLYASATDSGVEGTAHELRLQAGESRLLTSFESRAGVSVSGGAAVPSAARATVGSRSLRVRLGGRGGTLTWMVPKGLRNMGAARQLELDVFNPGQMNWRAPWRLKLVAFDAHGHRSWERYILEPGTWTHIALPLSGGGFDARSVTRLVVRVASDAPRSFFLDGLLAR